MGWQLTYDVDEFLAAADGFLRTDPTTNTLLLTIADTLQRPSSRPTGDAAALFGWYRAPEQGVLAGAFLQTPPHPVLITRAPGEAVRSLAQRLAVVRPDLAAVNADQTVAEQFASAWQQHTATPATVGRRSRLYRLHRLVPAQPAAPGNARPAGKADRELLLAWFTAFAVEADETAGDQAAVVDERLESGGLTLWQVDGVPVAMAGLTRMIAGMTRVAPVYTPIELRRRGYGAAVTTAVTQAALDAGATDVVLFTDLANPTSNALYQRLGYRPVEDRVEFHW